MSPASPVSSVSPVSLGSPVSSGSPGSPVSLVSSGPTARARPMSDFNDFVIFAVFLKFWGQSSNCVRKKCLNLKEK